MNFSLSQVRLLDGPFKARQDVHRRYLLAIEADRLLAPFRAVVGLPEKALGYGGWEARDIRGHSLGHYLSALALMFAATGDEALRERVFYVVTELDECQKASGDGALLPMPKSAFEALKNGEVEASGFQLNGVWVPFYTLHKVFAGLRDAFRYAGNEEALEVERRFADWLAGVLEPLDAAQIQEMLRCEHGGMNETLADLSAHTGNARYLAMAARFFHHEKVLEPMLRGEDNLNGMHANTQIPKVVGLAREWELGGEPSYRLAAQSFWNNVVNHRSFVNGGHSESEHFFPVEQFPQKLTPFTCETCNTSNLLKLTGHLFAWEPQAAQMDFVERAMINHWLVNIGQKEGEFGYFLNLGAVGVKVFSLPFDGWWCCVGTGLENPGRYGQQIYAHDEKALWVNLFLASRLDWAEKGVQLQQTTRFPDADATQFVFRCASPTRFALKLRHPYWCEHLEIRLNGELWESDSKPSSYCSIERQWRDGDRLEVRFSMRLRLEFLPHSEEKIAAVMFGPLVLAGVVPDEDNIENPASQRFSDHLKARGKTDAFAPVLVAPDAESLLAGLRPAGGFAEFHSASAVKPHDLRFVPFHRVYEEQYAVYFSLFSPQEWTQKEAELRAAQEEEQRREMATLDSVTPGFQQPEVEHSVQSHGSTTGDLGSRKYRSAQGENGAKGWFSYEMAVDPVAPMELVATFWGSEWGEHGANILVDGVIIASALLRADHPGDFFDQSYAVPRELTQGKTRVCVRFEALPNRPSVRLFGLRIEKAEESG